jgi:lipopolysaccharide transport system ATP-binding protein
MANNTIVVEKLSKRYFVGLQREAGNNYSYGSLRDILSRKARTVTKAAYDLLKQNPIQTTNQPTDFWALKDISFEVKAGEVLGIIGRNGAGKSTLLKILSRITDPTEGRVKIKGRVASLLEVGTGFHPELTGRENIYLNGAILGMSRGDINRKFDQIVDFAGVERFLDLPVKRYSSGMYVRLAFAVAAHVEPEILIVDEALSVGDYEFQQKCLVKMQDVASRQGRTVVLVSHNLAAITEMASRAILLDAGRIITDGTVPQALSAYISKEPALYTPPASKANSSSPHIGRAEVITSNGDGTHEYGQELVVKFWIRHSKPLSKGCFSFRIKNYLHHPVVHAWAYYPEPRFGQNPGETLLVCRFPRLRLHVGQYSLRTDLTEPPGREIYESLDGICQFEVVRNEVQMWGWRNDDCVYHEDWDWRIAHVKDLALTAREANTP